MANEYYRGKIVLTIFTTAKPFHGQIAVIQDNAIQSWTLLRPECEIILFGDEEGTAEAAAKFGINHIASSMWRGYT